MRALTALEEWVRNQMVFHSAAVSPLGGAGAGRTQTVKPDRIEQLRHCVLRLIDQLRNPLRPFPVVVSRVKEERWIGPVDQRQASHLGGIEAGVNESIQGGRRFAQQHIWRGDSRGAEKSVQIASLRRRVARIRAEFAPAGAGAIVPAHGGNVANARWMETQL
jgi:hypothetical protein